jgi:transcriptional regulator of acetoin/glycerol metabolism
MADSMPRVARLSPSGGLRAALAREREKAVRAAMKTAKGRIDVAAKALGISRRQLFRVLAEPAFADVQRAPTGVHREPDD